ncbi:hypothetical protein ACFL3A_14260 [Pseudomonadota bacterium]
MKHLRYRQAICKLLFTLLAAGLYSDPAHALDMSGFTLSGDQRVGYVEYEYDNPDGLPTINRGHKDSRGFYVIPKLSIETPTYRGFKAKVTGAGATDFGLNENDKQSRNFVFDPENNDPFSILQEMYVEYADKEHNVLVGRNEIVTPMIEADDYYMLANSFEVARYINSSFQDTELHIGYFGKMAGVWDSGDDGTEFNSMSDASFVPQINKDEADDAGVYYAAVDFNNGLHHAQLWNYYADDLYNTVFAQYNFTSKNRYFNYDAGAQFINFNEVGDLKSSDTRIDYSIYSLKYDAALENGFSVATGVAKYTDGDGQGSTLGAWGGYPYFANGMIFHFFEAGSLRDAASYKLQGAYDFSRMGIDKLSLALRYTYFDLESKYSISSDGRRQDFMKMGGIQLKYKFLSGGYFTGTYEQHKIDHEPTTWALRLIGGYKF